MAFSRGVAWLLGFSWLTSPPYWVTSSEMMSSKPLMAAISSAVQPYFVTRLGLTVCCGDIVLLGYIMWNSLSKVVVVVTHNFPLDHNDI